MASTEPAGPPPVCTMALWQVLLVNQLGMTSAYRALHAVRRTPARLHHQGYREAQSTEAPRGSKGIASPRRRAPVTTARPRTWQRGKR